jgi:hypothetical protein
LPFPVSVLCDKILNRIEQKNMIDFDL